MNNHFTAFRCLLSGGIFLIWSLNAEPLTWSNSLEHARASAVSQGKLVLLLAGRPSCDYCEHMKNVVCEAPGTRTIVDEAYVPWYVDIDKSSEWQPYASGLGGFTLPLICMFDPMTTNTWLFRRTALATATVFQNNLRSAMRSALPRPVNLVNNEVIHTTEYVVAGRIWTNAEPVNVFYRVWSGTAMVPFGNADGTANWAVQLSPHLTAGVSNLYRFEIYAEFANSSRSPTNALTFVYDPTIPAEPHLACLTVNCGVVTMMLENLTPGAVIRVERTLDLRQPGAWDCLTNLVPTRSAQEFSDIPPPACGGAFYRLSN